MKKMRGPTTVCVGTLPQSRSLRMMLGERVHTQLYYRDGRVATLRLIFANTFFYDRNILSNGILREEVKVHSRSRTEVFLQQWTEGGNPPDSNSESACGLWSGGHPARCSSGPHAAAPLASLCVWFSAAAGHAQRQPLMPLLCAFPTNVWSLLCPSNSCAEASSPSTLECDYIGAPGDPVS